MAVQHNSLLVALDASLTVASHLPDVSVLRQTGLMAAFGGGLISAFLLQNPQKFGISLFTDNTLGVTWTICWWLINYCPLDLVNTAHSFLPVRVVTKVKLVAKAPASCCSPHAQRSLP